MNNYYYDDNSNRKGTTRIIVFIFAATLLIIGAIVLIAVAVSGDGLFSCAPKDSSGTYKYSPSDVPDTAVQNLPYPDYAGQAGQMTGYDANGTADVSSAGYYMPAGYMNGQPDYEDNAVGPEYEEDGPGDDWWYGGEQYEQNWNYVPDSYEQDPEYMQDQYVQDMYYSWPEETPAPTADPDRVLKFGAKGDDVAMLQQRLIDLGYLEGYADGDFGSKTQAAVKWFQRQAGLAADGAAGKKTKEILYSDSAPYARVTNVMNGDIPLVINKKKPVDESFVPQDLVYLEDYMPTGLCMYKIRNLQGVREAVDALIDMLQAARADGMLDWQISEAYRTFDRQKEIFNTSVSNFMNNNGMNRSQATSATKQTVAEPGTSEHHSGLAFDITIPGKTFSDTKQYRWMKEHCWEYGFILRYTDEKQKITGFLGEEWHYRYVGREHALCMREMDMCLEEYVEYLNSH